MRASPVRSCTWQATIAAPAGGVRLVRTFCPWRARNLRQQGGIETRSVKHCGDDNVISRRGNGGAWPARFGCCRTRHPQFGRSDDARQLGQGDSILSQRRRIVRFPERMALLSLASLNLRSCGVDDLAEVTLSLP